MIKGLFSWLNNNASAVTAIATVILAILTYFYMMETHIQNSTSVRPYPQLDLRPENTDDGKFLFIYVKNIGRGPLIGRMIDVIGPDKESFPVDFVLAEDEIKKVRLAEEEKYRDNIVIEINIKYSDIYDKEYQRVSKLKTHINDTNIIYK